MGLKEAFGTAKELAKVGLLVSTLSGCAETKAAKPVETAGFEPYHRIVHETQRRLRNALISPNGEVIEGNVDDAAIANLASVQRDRIGNHPMARAEALPEVGRF